MHREVKKLETREMIATLAKLALAGAVLALVCWTGERWLLAGWAAQGFLLRLVLLLVTIGVGAATFFAAAMALRIGELDDVTALLRRKLGRRAKR
jgi:peptidoglycan biosynthesis protein MviN/MurJ (putative lipid II flippase)